MKNKNDYPYIREIVTLLGIGTILAAVVIMPGLPIALGAITKWKREYEFAKSQREWQKYNLRHLKRNLKRLQAQKIVEVIDQNGEQVIKLSKKGYIKYLKFHLEELASKTKNWNGKWWLVSYDISKFKKKQQKQLREILKYIHFYPLHKSVYLTPYPFKEAVEYLREYLGIADDVLVFQITNLENEEYYKKYFGLS